MGWPSPIFPRRLNPRHQRCPPSPQIILHTRTTRLHRRKRGTVLPLVHVQLLKEVLDTMRPGPRHHLPSYLLSPSTTCVRWPRPNAVGLVTPWKYPRRAPQPHRYSHGIGPWPILFSPSQPCISRSKDRLFVSMQPSYRQPTWGSLSSIRQLLHDPP
jgi:hypothetical protein